MDEFLIEYQGKKYFWDGKNIVAENSERYVLALSTNHFYKLRWWKEAPILEIDGVRMHLVKDFEGPLDYSEYITKRLRINKRDIILDICTGLGYTTIKAAEKGEKVITIEKAKEVLTLAKWNPWSAPLFHKKNIKIIQGKAEEKIKGLPDNRFSVIIHDPPRFSHAPKLYSTEFYKEMYRITKRKARIFHYIGTFGRRRMDFLKGVKERLRKAGFRVMDYDNKAQGLFIKKY